MMEPIARIADDLVSVDNAFADGADRVLAEDVLDGLTRPFKELPPKHFYDARGSELFDRICELPEYYPTRTERAILQRHAADMIELTGATELVELGSGSAEKTRVLLDAMDDNGDLRRYVPIDVSDSALRASAAQLVDAYPGLRVHGLVGDFERHLDRLPEPDGRRVMCFLGGTIGNFTPGNRRRFLRGLGRRLGADGHLLLGIDLVKDPRVIEAAYDDAAGVTAEFNRNVLHVLNRELHADFDVEQFDHVAFFDVEREWIEMRLRAHSPQTVHIADLDMTIQFAAREELRTEISAKFTRERIEGDFAAASLRLAGWFTDEDERFAVVLATPA
jgi:L-histidine N-alpha-methyltransferase